MIWALLLLGCGGGDGPAGCSEDDPCDWGQVCIEGACVEGVCATSAQCPIEHFCFEDACYPGCRADTDCPFGSQCDLQLETCEPSACQDTQIDCGFGEYCDTTTGSCFDAGEQFCRPCERTNQCADGDSCWNNFCAVNCNDRECPSGFDCAPFREDGEIVAYRCIAYCGFVL